ncbi:MAG: PD-(D/E)XK nuclease family protein [Planctomycetota bacterium]|jgi:ATP-dependent helicase/nuclease subunit B
MAVGFILGRSGTGKTSFCIKAIVEALLEPNQRENLILLVPEQATYQAERSILSNSKIGGYHRLSVLSFERLGFMLSGKNTALPNLSRTGQQMIIQRILREKKNELEIFGTSAEKSGLGIQLAETIAELHRYGKESEDIDGLINKLNEQENYKLTAQKFNDIGRIFKEYLRFIEGKFIDPDMQLAGIRKIISQSDFIKGSRLWVDGFSGFTASETVILTELMQTVGETRIALCLDASEIKAANLKTEDVNPTNLFYPTQKTYAQLLEIIKECKLKQSEPIILKEAVRFSDNPQLEHIEKSIFRQRVEKIPAIEKVRIIPAANRRAEARFAAREIIKIVKEKGYRYRDIAVIVPEVNSYEAYIRAYFDDYGVPFFTDKRKPLNQHPVVHLVRSALQAILSDFLSSDVFSYLKTDLAPIERFEADLLENYCLAFGVTEKDWISEPKWHFDNEKYSSFDEEQINIIRQKVIGPLQNLKDKLCTGSVLKKLTSRQFTEIIFEFLEKNGVNETISEWIEESEQANDKQTADEHRQFYEKLTAVFDELCEVFDGQEMGLEDYLSILDSAFSQFTLAFIPPKLDQVLVGAIDRSRHPDLKVAFLLGVTAKQFPAPISYSGILNEKDRFAGQWAEFELGAMESENLAQRQYLTYIAFTRPSDMLYITYPAVDEKGKVIVRSQFVDNLQELFENLNEESIARYEIKVEHAHNKNELIDTLCCQLGKGAGTVDQEKTGCSFELFEGLEKDGQFRELSCKVRAAIEYDNKAGLEGEVVKKLFSDRIRSSATRLSCFASCTYQHFARYILELKERQEFKFEPLDLGTFYHQVLDRVFHHIQNKKEDFTNLSDEKLIKILRVETEELIAEDGFINNFISHRQHNRFIIDCAVETLEEFLPAMAEMIRAGDFRPIASEVKFGEKDSKPGECKVESGNGKELYLTGKIDRLDCAEINGEKVNVVFDFKKSSKSFSWRKFYYGLDMQLAIYMLAVEGSALGEIVGAFYMPIERNAEKTVLSKVEINKQKFGYKAKGIFNGEFYSYLDKETSCGNSKYYSFQILKEGGPYGSYYTRDILWPADFEKVLQFAKKKTIQLANEIVSGGIDVAPYRFKTEIACKNCRYKALCRFDRQINKYNDLQSPGKKQVLAEIGTKNG